MRAKVRAHIWSLIAARPAGFPWLAIAGKVLAGWLVMDLDGRPPGCPGPDVIPSPASRAPGTPVPAHHRSSDASLLCRLQATTARNRELAQDNQRLRHQLA